MESPKAPCDLVDMSGVTSRSGRVIKKSTKLMDFTSPDDIEAKKAKKMAAASRKLMDKHYTEHSYDEGYSIKTERDDNYNPEHDGLDGEEDESDSDELQMVIKTEDDPEIEFATPKRSIYITEKSSKKKMIKDGKIVMGKAQRKDKGKTRYTAYMLWAKEARHQISISNPEMDFASVSKRLGEMWANVPTNVKYNWKRRAKRLANKMKKSNGGVKGPPQPSKYLQQKYYLNKNSTNNSGSPVTPTALTKQQKQLQKLLKNEKSKTQSIQNVQKQQKEKLSTALVSPTSSSSSSNKIIVVPASSSSSSSRATISNNLIQINRPMDLAPIDVAAHLKLLGESLINIGERLSQHEVGQIAVSGSFSVLLDSILCAMGSIMCCLLFVPELNFDTDPPILENDNSENPDQEPPKNLFQSIMDNVHYIMPGM